MRSFIKRLVQLTCFAAVSPMIVLSVERLGPVGDLFYYFFATLLAVAPGKIGGFLRVAFYKGVCTRISWDVNIGFGTFFTKRNVNLGDNVGIGAYCVIGSVNIEDHCWIASRVSIPSGKYQHGAVGSAESDGQPQFSQVHIGSKTWIGEAAVILNDIGKNCIVGAGSVVTRPVPEQDTVAGNPARTIKTKKR